MKWIKDDQGLFVTNCGQCGAERRTKKRPYGSNGCKLCGPRYGNGNMPTYSKERNAKIAKKMSQWWATQDSKKVNAERFKEWRASSEYKELQKSNHLKAFKAITGLTQQEYIDTLPEKKKYYTQVKYITDAQPLYLLENYDKPRGLAGIKGAYQLDHIISKNYGFKNNIPPEKIGDISNLRFIPWRENISKGDKLIGELI